MKITKTILFYISCCQGPPSVVPQQLCFLHFVVPPFRSFPSFIRSFAIDMQIDDSLAFSLSTCCQLLSFHLATKSLSRCVVRLLIVPINLSSRPGSNTCLFFFYFFLSCVNLFVKLSAFQHELEYSSGKCRRVILSHTSLTYEDVPAIHRHLCRIDDIRHSIYERDQSSVYKVKTVSNSIFFYKLPFIFFTDTRQIFTNSRLFFYTLRFIFLRTPGKTFLRTSVPNNWSL